MKEGVVAVVVLLCGRSGSRQRRLYRDEAGEQIASVEGAARVGVHFGPWLSIGGRHHCVDNLVCFSFWSKICGATSTKSWSAV